MVTITRATTFAKGGSVSLPENALPTLWEVSTDRTGWTSADLAFAYLESDLTGQDEAGLKIFRADDPAGPWTQLSTMADKNRNRVSTTVESLGYFAIAPIPTLVIDLAELGTTHPGFRIDGIDQDDSSGYSVSGAGDVNGDGLADLIIGAYGGNSDAGESYVIFGKPDNTPIDLATLGTGGFRIDGIDENDYSGRSVSGAGDVNGDGLADLIIGADGADSYTGESYVVFGKPDNAPTDLANLGTGGFRIDGIDSYDYGGRSVSGAGDVNGDGLADLVVGVFLADPGGDSYAGESYVIFGKADSDDIDLANLGAGGFRIDGIDEDDRSGESVSGAGDVNGDGLADLIVGASSGDPGDDSNAGESYVVFGKADNVDIDLESLGAGGFRIDGIDENDRSGVCVSGAGDVNGDGLADLIVGAFFADPGEDSSAGESYVIFGKADSGDIDLESLGAGGFRIDGIDSGDRSGRSVSGAGDVNGDGLADLIIGAYHADPGDDANAGESYVVFGKTNPDDIDLANLGADGFRIDGIDSVDNSGRSVSGAGDVNGDGLADLIVGAFRANPGDDSDAGESYVIFSPSTAPAVSTWKGFAKSGDAPALALGRTGDGSNHDTPDSRSWIDFEDGTGTGESNASLVNVTRDTDSFTKGASTLRENALPILWEVSTERTGWTSANLTLHYLDSELGDAFEQQLRLFQADSAEGPYSELPSTLNADRNQISAIVSEFGFFAIIPVNAVPVADDQMVSTDEDIDLAITLTGSDLEMSNLTFTIQNGPTDGTLSGNAPNVTYDPDPGFVGADSFTFVVNDGEIDSSEATISIAVNDLSAPTVELMTSSPDPTNDAFEVSVSFSEEVLGFTIGDISLTNGDPTLFQETGTDGSQYSFLVTPVIDGEVTVTIPRDSVMDLSNNPNSASNTLALQFDGTPPEIILSTASLDVIEPFTVSADFSEPNAGFELNDLDITNGTASGLQANGDDFTFTITADNEGNISVSIPSGSVTDQAGNENPDSNTLIVTFAFSRDLWLID